MPNLAIISRVGFFYAQKKDCRSWFLQSFLIVIQDLITKI
ncbi:hypothetical protein FM106_12695 [Brachybacterium faecium]|nr:hypothetical protein FM106_12695 [Brachybacterium faecium]